MLVDLYANRGRYCDRTWDEFIEHALAAKTSKMPMPSNVYYANEPDRAKNALPGFLSRS